MPGLDGNDLAVFVRYDLRLYGVALLFARNKLRRSKLRGIQRRRGLVLPRIGSKEFHLACIQRSKVDGLLVQTLVLVLAALLLDVAADRLLAAVTPYGVYEVAA